VLFDGVEVVEQPFAGRADVDAFIGGLAERLARVEEDLVRLLESLEERCFLAALAWRPNALSSREGARMLPESVGAEQLAADGTDERLLPTIRCAR
jgi:hypothetical protein